MSRHFRNVEKAWKVEMQTRSEFVRMYCRNKQIKQWYEVWKEALSESRHSEGVVSKVIPSFNSGGCCTPKGIATVQDEPRTAQCLFCDTVTIVCNSVPEDSFEIFNVS